MPLVVVEDCLPAHEAVALVWAVNRHRQAVSVGVSGESLLLEPGVLLKDTVSFLFSSEDSPKRRIGECGGVSGDADEVSVICGLEPNQHNPRPQQVA